MLNQAQVNKWLAIIKGENRFYCESSTFSLKAVYAKYPGQLLVHRFGNYSDAFRIESNRSEKAKKLIIFSDWTLAKQYDAIVLDNFAKNVNHIVNAFLQLNFKLLIWVGNQAVEVNSIEEFQDIITMVRPATDQELVDKFIEDNIGSDALVNLDYFELRKLIGKQDRAFYSDDNYFYADAEGNLDETLVVLDAWLKSKRFTVTFQFPTRIEYVTNKYPNNIVGVELNFIFSPVLSFGPAVRHIRLLRIPSDVLMTIPLESDKLSRIVRLEVMAPHDNIFSVDASLIRYLNIVALAKNIRVINVDFCWRKGHTYYPSQQVYDFIQTINLDHIEELDFSECELPYELALRLFLQAKNAKGINFNHFESFFSLPSALLIANDASFPALRNFTIKISRGEHTKYLLEKIIAKSANLEVLQLAGLNSEGASILRNLRLPRLQKLYLRQPEGLSGQDLLALMRQYSQIIHLDWAAHWSILFPYGLKHFAAIIKDGYHFNTFFRFLTLFLDSYEPKNAEEFANSRCRKINMAYIDTLWENRKESNGPEQISFPTVSELTLDKDADEGVLTDYNDLYLALLRATPNITTLRLKNLPSSYLTIPANTIISSQLRVLQIERWGNLAGINAILANATKLEELSLDCALLSSSKELDVIFANIHGSCLRKLKLTNLKLKWSDFNTLCQKFPNLEELVFIACDFIMDGDACLGLPYLKKLTIDCANEIFLYFLIDVFKLFLLLAPNLVEVEADVYAYKGDELSFTPDEIQLLSRQLSRFAFTGKNNSIKLSAETLSWLLMENPLTELSLNTVCFAQVNGPVAFPDLPKLRKLKFSNVSAERPDFFNVFKRGSLSVFTNLKELVIENTELIWYTAILLIFCGNGRLKKVIARDISPELVLKTLESVEVKSVIIVPKKRTPLLPKLTAQQKQNNPLPRIVGQNADNKTAAERKKEVKQLFIPARDPDGYRLKIYSKVSTKDQDVIALETEDTQLEKVDIPGSQEPLYDKFRELYASRGDEISLCPEFKILLTTKLRPVKPSLFATEKMLCYYSDSPLDIEIYHSKSKGRYYIRATREPTLLQVYTVSFILDHDKQPDKEFSRAIQVAINYAKSFHDGEILFKPNASGIEKLRERHKKKVGSCETRTIDLQHELQNQPAVISQVIRNKQHCYIEIYNGSHLQAVDLGGYPADQIVIPIVGAADYEKTLRGPGTKTENSLRASAPPSLAPSKTSTPLPVIEERQPAISDAELYAKFTSWRKKNKENILALDQLCQRFTLPAQKIRVKLNDPKDCERIIAHFTKQHPDKPWLLIDNPDDLQWQAPGLKFHLDRTLNSLHIKEPFTRLRDFINKNPHGILFINFSRFNEEELAALHCILDKTNRLESESLPPLTIVGFYSRQVGSDFKTRFTNRYSLLDQPIQDIYHGRFHELTSFDQKNSPTVKLYRSDDWEILLLGFLSIDGDEFTQEPSEFLANAHIKPSPLRHLHLINPPLHLREFQLFWQQALQKSSFSLYGREFYLAPQFQVSYSFDNRFELDVIVTADATHPANTYPLNSHTFQEFFTFPQYHKESNRFYKKLGLFEREKFLHLVATSALPANYWQRLLAEAKKYGAKISLSLAVEVQLPSELMNVPFRRIEIAPLEYRGISDPITLIHSRHDCEAIAEHLLKQYPKAKYLNLSSAHDFGNLFYHVLPSFRGEKLHIDYREGGLWQALQQKGEKVIIAGTLPQPLLNALAHTLMAGRPALVMHDDLPFKGQLIIITDSNISFAKLYLPPAIPKVTHRVAGPTPKENRIPSTNNSLDKRISAEYKQRRFTVIHDSLQRSGLTALVGHTGIGKSTYLYGGKKNVSDQSAFEKDYQHYTGKKVKLYIGPDQIDNFGVHNGDPGNKNVDAVLILDEATLSRFDLSKLKGVKGAKRHLLNDGPYHELQPNQSILLVDNPKEYGGARQQHEFIERYCETVICERPPHAYLYHEIIKPILARIIKEDAACEEAAKIILNFYDTVNKLALKPGKPDLLTPRQLKIVSLVFNVYRKQFANADNTFLMLSACMTVLGDRSVYGLAEFLDRTYDYQYKNFEMLQEVVMRQRFDILGKKSDSFTFTPSRYSLLHLIDTMLEISQEPGVQFGMLLEGVSGIGKSELIVNYFKLRKIEYLHMAFGKNHESDSKLLLQAMQKKRILIDEYNAGSHNYEGLLNTLQEGLVIATQNSLKNAGRKGLTDAQEARFILKKVATYPLQDLIEIIVGYGLAAKQAQELAKLFHRVVEYAKKQNVDIPNLRDLEVAINREKSIPMSAVIQQTLMGRAAQTDVISPPQLLASPSADVLAP